MKKTLALMGSLALVFGLATPAMTATKYFAVQKTLSAFSSSAITLTSAQRDEVKRAVDANPNAEKFICTGIRYFLQPMSENIKVRARAKAACEYAKQLNPSLSTWFQNKPTQARSYAGKVLLTLKVPEAEPLTESFTSAPIEMCKLVDQRKTRLQPNNVGFPLQVDTVPATGVANFAMVPVSFTDAGPENELLPWARQQMQQMVDWYEHFSQGKLTFDVQYPTDWVKLDVPSTDYSSNKGLANSPTTAADRDRNAMQIELTQKVVDGLGSSVDFSNLHGLILVFPRAAKGINNSILQRGIEISTLSGIKSLFVWGSGTEHVPWADLEWALYAHEILHSQGVALHAPGNGSNFGLGQNQYAKSGTPTGWEMFRMGWLDDNQVACVDAAQLPGESVINLSPLEDAAGMQELLVIRLSSTKAIVVESRRPTGYSKSYKELTGLVVYEIDVTQDNDRASESTGDPGNSSKYPKWGYLLAPDGTAGVEQSTVSSDKFIFKQGDKVTLDGFTLTLGESGSLDSVVLSGKG